MRRVGQAPTGGLGARDRVGPVTGCLLELRSVDQALAAVGHQVGLRVAPRTERIGPLGRPLEIEQLHAFEDDRAVDDARW